MSTGANSNSDYFPANLRYSAGPVSVCVTLSHLNKPVDGDVGTNAVLLAGTWGAGAFSVLGGAQIVRNVTRAAAVQDDRTEFYAGMHVPVGADQFWLGAGAGSTRHVDGSRATQASAA